MRAALAVVCFLAIAPGMATTGPIVLTGNEKPRTLLVLDPVDLSVDAPKAAAGKFLRQRLEESPRWKVTDGDTARKHMSEAQLDPDLACKEFQCAFDAGSALGAEFVIFGTLAPLGELQAYTLNLMHVPTAQVVWARAGEALRFEDEYPFQAQKRALDWAVADLDLSRLDLRKVPGRATVAVFGDDGGSVQAKAVHERAVAHLYASRRFDLVNRPEMEDLLKAMDVQPPEPHAPVESLWAVGKKLDVRYALSSRLVKEKHSYSLKVSVHDYENKGGRYNRAFPTKESGDLGKLLRVEDRFLSGLAEHGPWDRPASSPSKAKLVGKVVTMSMALAAGAGLGYLAYQNKREADGEYQRFRDSQSQQMAESTRQKVQDKDEAASRLGILGGVSLVVGASVWAF